MEVKHKKNRKLEEVEGQELKGVEEGEDGISNEEGDEIDGEEEWAPPDWRVRGRPRNRPTRRRKEKEHEATHVPSRDWCTHCMMGGRRTHHHVTEQKKENQSRRPTIAMDHYVMKMRSAVNAQTMSEESVICIAVKEDRHQHIMSSVALKRESPNRGRLRVAQFICLIGYHEITLKSDMGPAIIAFRCRVADMC